MRKWRHGCGIGAAALLAACAAAQGDGLKVAVVDMNRLINRHPQTEIDQRVMDQHVEEFKAEQDDMRAEFNRLKDEFDQLRREAGNRALSEAAQQEKGREAEQKLLVMQRHERRFREQALQKQEELTEQKLRMRRRVVGLIRDAVETYAKRHGVALVFDTAGVGGSGAELVAYSSSSLDITDAILEAIRPGEGAGEL